MSTSLRVISRNDRPQKRGCLTCRFGARSIHISSRCQATGRYIDYERRDTEGACGVGGNLWEAKPPRLGLVGWIKRLLWGDQAS